MHVIHNGIDLDQYRKVDSTAALDHYGIDPNTPYLLFVGRITRQKGFQHFVSAIQFMDRDFQIVLCAAAPDTPGMAEEMKTAMERAKAHRHGIIWIDEMVDQKTACELYSHAAVFVCPSIYEPFGIINLEAMACETAVVASAVGGIKEVVVDGETGFLVALEQMNESPFEATNPEEFARDLATRINQLMNDRQLRQRFGKAGRKRAEENFAWAAIAEKTKALRDVETLKRFGIACHSASTLQRFNHVTRRSHVCRSDQSFCTSRKWRARLRQFSEGKICAQRRTGWWRWWTGWRCDSTCRPACR